MNKIVIYAFAHYSLNNAKYAGIYACARGFHALALIIVNVVETRGAGGRLVWCKWDAWTATPPPRHPLERVRKFESAYTLRSYDN